MAASKVPTGVQVILTTSSILLRPMRPKPPGARSSQVVSTARRIAVQ